MSGLDHTRASAAAAVHLQRGERSRAVYSLPCVLKSSEISFVSKLERFSSLSDPRYGRTDDVGLRGPLLSGS